MSLDINIIVSEQGNTQDANDLVSSSSVPASDKDKNDAKAKGDKEAMKMTILANYAISSAKSLAKQTANYFISNIGRNNGDDNYQNIINSQIQQATNLVGVAGSTIAGAKLGSMAGPFGAILGLVIGTTSGALNYSFNKKEKEQDYQFKMFQENTNQAYNLARANYSVLNGRLR